MLEAEREVVINSRSCDYGSNHKKNERRNQYIEDDSGGFSTDGLRGTDVVVGLNKTG